MLTVTDLNRVFKRANQLTVSLTRRHYLVAANAAAQRFHSAGLDRLHSSQFDFRCGLCATSTAVISTSATSTAFPLAASNCNCQTQQKMTLINAVLPSIIQWCISELLPCKSPILFQLSGEA